MVLYADGSKMETAVGTRVFSKTPDIRNSYRLSGTLIERSFDGKFCDCHGQPSGHLSFGILFG